MRGAMIALAAALFAVAPAEAKALWLGFEHGMSVAEVQAADPRVAINPRAQDERLKDGSACALTLTVAMEGAPFRGCFYFRDDRLVQIVVDDRAANHPRFRGLLGRLRAEHGPDYQQAQAGRIHEARWTKANQVSVQLMYIEIGKPMLRIVYEPTGAL